jgi:hypothetical protein
MVMKLHYVDMRIMMMMLTTWQSMHVDNQMLIVLPCIFSIGCKPILVNQLNLANNMFKSNWR